MSAPLRPSHPAPTTSGHLVGGVVGSIVLGALVATFGTLVHRQWAPWMLVAALVATLAGGMWMRSWRGSVASAGYLVGWGVVSQVLAGGGPGGNVLIGAQPVGYVWLYGGIVAALAPLVLPRRWFEPRAEAGRVSGAP